MNHAAIFRGNRPKLAQLTGGITLTSTSSFIQRQPIFHSQISKSTTLVTSLQESMFFTRHSPSFGQKPITFIQKPTTFIQKPTTFIQKSTFSTRIPTICPIKPRIHPTNPRTCPVKPPITFHTRPIHSILPHHSPKLTRIPQNSPNLPESLKSLKSLKTFKFFENRPQFSKNSSFSRSTLLRSNTISRRYFATKPPESELAVPVPGGRFTAEEEAHHREIERWGASFDISHLKRNYFEYSFARSSGPGGQNVNKVSSKAQLRFVLDNADWIHSSVRRRIKEQHGRYVSKNMENKNEFFIQSEVHRTQEQNTEECIKKIYEVIKDCCAVPKETSDVQKKKVQKMIELQKKKDLEIKKRLKEKKSDRRGSGKD